MKKLSILFISLLVLSGCASTAHKNRLDELDAQYKAGTIDSVQYQVKYNEEVQNYNGKRAVAAAMYAHR